MKLREALHTLAAAAADGFRAVLIVGLAFALSNLDVMIDDHHAEQEAAKEALIQQRVQQRFEKAAQEICGMNASYIDLGEGAIQCVTKHGKAIKVSM